MKLKYLLLMAVTGGIVSLDQLTKSYIHTQFRVHESIPVIDGFFNITYVRNPGAAFGFLAQAPREYRETFFLVLAPAAMLLILFMLRAIPQKDRLSVLSLSLIFSGALGNYIDRLRFKFVVDFLDFYLGTYHWPAFNVADSAIVVGIIIWIFIAIFRGDTQTKEKRA